jgi:hypothetical protein
MSRREPLHPGDPALRHGVIQEPGIVGLEIEGAGRQHLEPELVLRVALENFPCRLVLHDERPIVQNGGMLGPHGTCRIRARFPIPRPSIRWEMVDKGHLRRDTYLQQKRGEETCDHCFDESGGQC